MDILGYIENYGHLSFKEKPLNDVDALILSQLTYINFEKVAPCLSDGATSPFYLKDIQNKFVKDLAYGEFTYWQNIKLLPLVKDSPRFRNIGVTCVKNENCVQTEKQFCGITFLLPNDEIFIAFRGTDLTLVAWKEDLNMCFLDTIPAQESAIKYVNKVTSFYNTPFYLGGHSKGGNLALYSSFYMNIELCSRCKAAYSFDGPGFYDTSWLNNPQFELMKDKLIKIVPYQSLVGILMNHTKHSRVVDAKSFSIFQHNPYNWKLSKHTGDFVYLKKRARQSYINERALETWLASLTKQELMMTVDVIFDFLGGTKASIIDLAKALPKTLANFVKVHKKYTKAQRQKISEILKRLFYYWKKSRKYYRDHQLQLRREKRSIKHA